MWIEEIYIERFGACHGLHVRDLSPGLNLVFGPNEAGKSTIAEFVRSVFFGFRRKGAGVNIYEAPGGGYRSGRLKINVGGQECLRIERREKVKHREGLLTITDQQGNFYDPESIPCVGSRMERPLYESLCAFDLDGIRQLDRETLQGRIVGVSLGSLAVSPLEILKRLDRRIKELTHKSANNRRSLHAVGSRLAEVEARLKVLGQKPEEYAALVRELRALDLKRKATSEKIRQKEKRLQEVGNVLRQEGEWKRLAELDAEIVEISGAQEFPEDGISRLEHLLERLAEAQQKQQGRATKIAQLESRLEELRPNLAILPYSEQIESLVQRRSLPAGKKREVTRVFAEIAKAKKGLEAEMAKLGEGWGFERLARVSLSHLTDHQILGFVRGWKGKHANITRISERLEEVKERCDRLYNGIRIKSEALPGLQKAGKGHLEPKERELLAEWKEEETKVRYLTHRLSEIRAAQQRLGKDGAEVAESLRRVKNPISTRWSPIWMVASLLSFALGGAALFALWRSVPPVGVSVLIVGGIFFLVGIATVVGANLVRDRDHGRRNETLIQSLGHRRDRIRLEAQSLHGEKKEILHSLKESATRMEALAEQVLGNPSPRREEVLAVEEVSFAAEGAVTKLHAMQDAVKREQSDLETELRRKSQLEAMLHRACTEFESLRAVWITFLKENALDSWLEPEDARELVQRIVSLKKGLKAVAEQERALASLTEEFHRFARDVRELALELESSGMESAVPSEKNPLAVIEAWNGALVQAREAASEHKALSQLVDDQQNLFETEERRIEDLKGRIAALMGEAQVSDEQSFREKASRHRRFAVLDQERRLLTDKLLKVTGSTDQIETGESLGKTDWDKLRAEEIELRSELERLKQEVELSANQSGRIGREIEALETEDEADRLTAERERLIARLNIGVRDFMTLKLASDLVSRTVLLYESQKQPLVLKRMSEIFNFITENAYVSVRFPPDAQSIVAERSDGMIVGEGLMSRATLEQLYLSLRLAHLEVYTGPDSTVPLVLDDILVNFDPGRARRTARIMAQFAEDTGTQILFFTCHPHFAELFPSSAAIVNLAQQDSHGRKPRHGPKRLPDGIALSASD